MHLQKSNMKRLTDFRIYILDGKKKLGFKLENFYFAGINFIFLKRGAEDDDLRVRAVKMYQTFRKRPGDINRYFMNSHKSPDSVNSKRHEILNDLAGKYKSKGIFEGLNTTRNKYSLFKIEKNFLFTHFFIDHPNSNK